MRPVDDVPAWAFWLVAGLLLVSIVLAALFGSGLADPASEPGGLRKDDASIVAA